jgi:RNA polymerase sigma-70 factor, ECF subfamily
MNNYNIYSDEKLLALLKEDKPLCDQAFYVLYNRYALKLNTYCLFRNNTRQTAEDVFQECWIRFDKAIKSGKAVDNVFAYLITIARNLSIDKHKKEAKQVMVDSENFDRIALDQIPNQFQFENELENEELISLIKIAANSLDDKYKETFVLKRFCDMPYKEIAELTGNSVANIKKRSSRAMEKIKEILKPYISELS